jgi:hypothetical protein
MDERKDPEGAAAEKLMEINVEAAAKLMEADKEADAELMEADEEVTANLMEVDEAVDVKVMEADKEASAKLMEAHKEAAAKLMEADDCAQQHGREGDTGSYFPLHYCGIVFEINFSCPQLSKKQIFWGKKHSTKALIALR